MAKPNDAPAPIENPIAGKPESGSFVAVPWWRHLLEPKWLVLFVVLAVVVPGIFLALSRFSSAAGTETNGHDELSIGEFHFRADANERSPIVAAAFSLHLALIPEAEAAGRARLASHKFRVQQAVEQLLRQAHGGDFEDPRLGDLKRQLQEQVNETLGVRAVADVIVTDLELEYSAGVAASADPADVAGTPPWGELSP